METRPRSRGGYECTGTPCVCGFARSKKYFAGTACQTTLDGKLCTFALLVSLSIAGHSPMDDTQLDRFIRVPTDFLEALLRARLSGAQLRIVLWVLRYTFGWNRQSTPFSWYRIAKELQMPRPAVYRAGKALAQSKVLVVQEGQLAIQTDYTAWNDAVLDAGAVAGRQRTTELNVAREQRHW